MTDLTVAICTYNRAKYLDDCLRSLSLQQTTKTFTALIIDNASTDETPAIARKWTSADSRFKYLLEPVKGLARARNTALAHCDSPYIAYTDDDATVSIGWVDSYLNRFFSLPNDVFAVGGEIDPYFEIEPPSWLTIYFLRYLSAGLEWTTAARFIGDGEWICEANSAYRADTLRKYGGFSEELGRRDDLLLSGENLVNEIAALDGNRIFFDPGIRVRHFIPKARLTKDWMRRRHFWQGVTDAIAFDIAKSKYGKRRNLWRELDIPTTAE